MNGHTAEEHPILLIVADWRERAFILATLEEQGYDVRALPGITIAIGFLIRRPHVRPSLVILDPGDDPDVNERTLGDLRAVVGDIPWLVIAPVTRSLAGESLLKETRVAYMRRPVRVGDIVDRVKQLLQGEGE